MPKSFQPWHFGRRIICKLNFKINLQGFEILEGLEIDILKVINSIAIGLVKTPKLIYNLALMNNPSRILNP
jgi:hypothetical protein